MDRQVIELKLEFLKRCQPRLYDVFQGTRT